MRQISDAAGSATSSVSIISFTREHQVAAAGLINRDLGERFGHIDESMNPDLFNIERSYRDGSFLVAVVGDQIVGTGSILPLGRGEGQIARMHTASTHRRMGIATQILSKLEDWAKAHSLTAIVLETNTDWDEAVAFYARNGYIEVARNDEGIRFRKVLC